MTQICVPVCIPFLRSDVASFTLVQTTLSVFVCICIHNWSKLLSYRNNMSSALTEAENYWLKEYEQQTERVQLYTYAMVLYFATLKLYLLWQCTLKFLKSIYRWKSSWGLFLCSCDPQYCKQKENMQKFIEWEEGDASGCAPKRITVEASIDLSFFSGSCYIFIMGR